MIAIFITLPLNDFGDKFRKIHGIIQQAKFNEYFVWYYENLIDVNKSGYNQNALVVYLWIYIPIPTMIMLIVYTWDVYVLECIGHLNNCYVKEISYVCTIRYSWIPLHVVFSNFFLSASKGRHLVFHRILIFFGQSKYIWEHTYIAVTL